MTEGRYLLSGASDGSAAVYDIQHTTDYDGGLIAKHKNLFVVDKQHNHGHKFAISTAIWYPIDTGLFITGSFDHHVKVWDTNMIQVGFIFVDLSLICLSWGVLIEIFQKFVCIL